MTSSPMQWSTLDRPDGSVEIARWGDNDPTRGAVLIAHGASEHAARYARFAQLLIDAGWAVYGIDHRGHGRTADLHGTLGIARPGGWDAMVDDLGAAADHIASENTAAEHPGSPIVLFGHSMGSLLAQRAMQLHGDRFAAVILSGTSGSLEGADDLIGLLQGIEDAEGADHPSALFAGMFAGFNEPFAAAVTDPTGFEWLSRDADEVQTYVDDPWCGGDLSNGFVTDMISGMAQMWSDGAEDAIPEGLPILLVAGDQDPVGDNGASVRALAERYETMGRGPITLVLYPDARHELLNETNRAEVERQLIEWVQSTV